VIISEMGPKASCSKSALSSVFAGLVYTTFDIALSPKLIFLLAIHLHCYCVLGEVLPHFRCAFLCPFADRFISILAVAACILSVPPLGTSILSDEGAAAGVTEEVDMPRFWLALSLAAGLARLWYPITNNEVHAFSYIHSEIMHR